MRRFEAADRLSRQRWLLRLLVLFALLNLAWELLQLPFYTLWSTGTGGQIAYAILHCTAGDVLIGIAVAVISRMAARRAKLHFLLCFILLSLAYTVFSEWMNVSVSRNWAYSASMPLIPPLGTGLTPVLQWIIVPLLTWIMAGDRARAKLAGRNTGLKEPQP